MQSPITIFVPFTRRWAVDRWLDNLKAVEHDPANTSLALLVDADEMYIVNQFHKFAEANGYRKFVFRMNDDHHPNEMKLAVRRQRIAHIKNQSKDLINLTDGEYIISLEDDTVFDRLTNFDTLLRPLIDDDGVGFVQGVQMGRWSTRMIGAWQADNDQEPEEISTLLPGEGYEAITGGGWYGYATRRNLYLNCDYYSSSAQPWGPDVNFGIWLNRQGYHCLIDWNTVFGHDDHGTIAYPDDPKHSGRLVRTVYTRNKTTGKWERTDHEQDRY